MMIPKLRHFAGRNGLVEEFINSSKLTTAQIEKIQGVHENGEVIWHLWYWTVK